MSWAEKYGAYGAQWEAYVERSEREGFAIPTAFIDFHENCMAAISQAREDWERGLAFSCVALWSYDNDLEELHGRNGILAKWSLVLDSITTGVGWKLHTWSLDMGKGSDYTASALFMRPE